MEWDQTLHGDMEVKEAINLKKRVIQMLDKIRERRKLNKLQIVIQRYQQDNQEGKTKILGVVWKNINR